MKKIFLDCVMTFDNVDSSERIHGQAAEVPPTFRLLP